MKSSLPSLLNNFGKDILMRLSIYIYSMFFSYGGDNNSATLAFDYSVMTQSQYKNGGWGVLGSTTGWIPVAALNFQSLVNGTSGVPVGPVTYVLVNNIVSN